MDLFLYGLFLATSFAVIILPGPNVLVIVSTSLLHGRSRGLQTVAGTSCAMAIQLLVVALGTSWLVRLAVDGVVVLKWIGLAYLLGLGLVHLRHVWRDAVTAAPPDPGIAASFRRGFIVSLGNPKTLLFFSAFLPQFVAASIPYGQQIFVLSLSFLLMATILDSSYALFAAHCRPLLDRVNSTKLHHFLGAMLYLGAGVLLALNRRS